MRFNEPQSLKQLAGILNCDKIGPDDFEVLGINEIHVVQAGELVFVDHPKYYDKALQSAASTILINKAVDCPPGKALLISDDPFRDFNHLTQRFNPFQKATALVAASARIGEGVIIQPGAFVGNNVSIGDRSVIHPNVCIYDNCIIGNDVTIHAGTILGADAFYYKNRPSGFDKLLSGGRVVIEDEVEIGALCSIDKGVTADTRIGKGTKIDDQVHIGHDTVIGKKCLIASQTGIAGCVTVEDEVTMWGKVGVISAITIGSKAVIMAGTGVSKSLPGDKTYFGAPAAEARKKYAELAALRSLPSMMSGLQKLLQKSKKV